MPTKFKHCRRSRCSALSNKQTCRCPCDDCEDLSEAIRDKMSRASRMVKERSGRMGRRPGERKGLRNPSANKAKLVEDALKEIKSKAKFEIDAETAWKWAARAAAAYQLSLTSNNLGQKLDFYTDAEDYLHEAMEHSATALAIDEFKEINEWLSKKRLESRKSFLDKISHEHKTGPILRELRIALGGPRRGHPVCSGEADCNLGRQNGCAGENCQCDCHLPGGTAD